MNAIGVDANDWDKHFKLMADIDFTNFHAGEDKPLFNIIAPDIDESDLTFTGPAFTGSFEGNNYKITNLTINAVEQRRSYLGLYV